MGIDGFWIVDVGLEVFGFVMCPSRKRLPGVARLGPPILPHKVASEAVLPGYCEAHVHRRAGGVRTVRGNRAKGGRLRTEVEANQIVGKLRLVLVREHTEGGHEVRVHDYIRARVILVGLPGPRGQRLPINLKDQDGRMLRDVFGREVRAVAIGAGGVDQVGLWKWMNGRRERIERDTGDVKRRTRIVGIISDGGTGLRKVEKIGVADVSNLPGPQAFDETADLEVGLVQTGGVEQSSWGTRWCEHEDGCAC